jgi:dipeptidyl aminopeptidase/acylaminoacyl peptidase
MRKILLSCCLLAAGMATAQQRLTPEMLWSLKRVSAEGLSPDGRQLYYSSRTYDMATEKSTATHYILNLADGSRRSWSGPEGKTVLYRGSKVWYARDEQNLYHSLDAGESWETIFQNPSAWEGDIKISPDGKWIAYTREVLVKPMLGTDIYPDLPKNTAHIYTDLNYRHWDTWEDGKFSHIFVARVGDQGEPVDIMANEPYDAPQKPFGGLEDFVWSPDSKGLLYVCKKKFGKEYAVSTNTDLYYYDVNAGHTINWTAGMNGYDTHPVFSPDGRRLAWLSMAREGYEADKNDIYILEIGASEPMKYNLTGHWNGTVSSFAWDQNSQRIYFNAPHRGTEQLFSVEAPRRMPAKPAVRQITEGVFDINGIIGQSGKELIVSRSDMNHASELFAVTLKNGKMRPLTQENEAAYQNIGMSRTELRMVPTSDGKEMGVWVIYPPDFDATKKYPTLLYCQGGPQSALSQFYSFRWNFQLMAAQGYIVVAPNRRGMPGWGTQWNEAISQDWGGQAMRDYLSAIDDVAREPYVDTSRLGCVGASYGGYSAFMLAGIHGNRFKSFIAHDGLFDLKSWYGTTEELWFANWDIGGPYWQKPEPESYKRFDPSNLVDQWNAPIMIIQGGIDFRVPIEQGLEAFQAAQLRGIKSKLLYLPNENHWVLHPQNALVWQREFFKWLEETLK